MNKRTLPYSVFVNGVYHIMEDVEKLEVINE